MPLRSWKLRRPADIRCATCLPIRRCRGSVENAGKALRVRDRCVRGCATTSASCRAAAPGRGVDCGREEALPEDLKAPQSAPYPVRSEEHTSELQSRENL